MSTYRKPTRPLNFTRKDYTEIPVQPKNRWYWACYIRKKNISVTQPCIFAKQHNSAIAQHKNY